MSSLTRETPRNESVSTIRADGSRRFLFPADAHGRFERLRRISALVLIGFYLSLPWIKINGFPAVFLDVASRRFHLFGLTLAAQDLWLMFFVISGLGFSLFFVTALLGRVWCGWACPQTVFLDHVYRRIERWVDGDAVKRRALAQAPWSTNKVVRRTVKHALYLIVSAAITHLFLAYFVSLPEVWTMMSAAPAEHWGAFVFIAVATGALYFNYAWFREQLCIVICPYGRLQSALIDDHSLVIGYDAKRGEPRGRRAQTSCNLIGYTTPGAAAPGVVAVGSAVGELGALGAAAPAVRVLGGAVSGVAAVGVAQPGTAAGPDGAASVAATGDCVDCFRCVQVCPTGIDIRQGLQMECIGCTACIDACDDVMTRLRRPTGLIRYDSQKAFSGGRTSWLRSRTILYGVLLAVGALVAGWAFSTVRPANFGISRMTGAPYFVDENTVRNQFLVRILNKRSEPARFVVHVTDLPKGVRRTGFEQTVSVGALEESVQPLIIQQDRRAYVGPFEFDVRVEGIDTGFHLDRDVEFLGPEVRLLREEEEKK